jgi:hypothetical protein
MLIVSVSQCETYSHCARKWGWAYLEGFKGSNAFAQFGTEVHKQLENWLTTGAYNPHTEAGKVAESGFHHWPAPRTPGVKVEVSLGHDPNTPLMKDAQWVRHTTVDGEEWAYGYVGFQDVDAPTPAMPGDDKTVREEDGPHGVKWGDLFGRPPGSVMVGDHKTTTDFRWAKTQDDLLNDLQASVYALAAMDRHNVDVVLLQWVYYRTRGAKKSHVVRAVMPRALAEDVVRRKGDAVALQILQHRLTPGTRALDLVPNPSACEDYGGCVHRERCNLSSNDALKGKFAHMNLKEKMLARLRAKEGGTDPSPAAGVPEKAAKVIGPKQDPINPPEKAKLGATSKSPAVNRSAIDAAKAAARKAEKEAEEAAIREAEEAALREVEEAAKQATEAVERLAGAGQRLADAGPIRNGAAIGTLLVDCVPTSFMVDVVFAQDLIARVHDELRRELDLADFRLAEYGKGPGLLASGVRKLLAQGQFGGQYVYLDTKSDAGRACLEVFAEFSAVVIRRV